MIDPNILKSTPSRKKRSVSSLILFNANVVTLDSTLPRAQLVAAKDGKIASVWSNERLHELKQEKTQLIDCHGKTILPGFIDSDFHLHGFAESLVSVDLSPRNKVHSISDIQARVRQEAEKLPPRIPDNREWSVISRRIPPGASILSRIRSIPAN